MRKKTEKQGDKSHSCLLPAEWPENPEHTHLWVTRRAASDKIFTLPFGQSSSVDQAAKGFAMHAILSLPKGEELAAACHWHIKKQL